MPLYKTTLRKAFRSGAIAYKWSNVYYVNANTLNDAAVDGLSIWFVAERELASTLTWLYEVYTTPVDPVDPLFDIRSPNFADPNVFGALAITGDLLPEWNCIRQDFTIPNSRPSRKFIRVPLSEGQIAYKTPSTGLADAITEYQNQMNTLLGFLRDESGNSYSGFGPAIVTSRKVGKEAFADVPATPGL